MKEKEKYENRDILTKKMLLGTTIIERKVIMSKFDLTYNFTSLTA